jgi:LPS-assembly lipoprotein
MWLPKACAGLTAVLLLAGCNAAPLYGSGPGLAPSAPLIAYAEPVSRLDQVIYNELRLRLPPSQAPGAPRLAVTAATTGFDEALSRTANPNTLRAITVTATATLTPAAPGANPVRITRAATANYTTNDSALSSQEAVIEASERAARAAAEQLRLALLAELARQ